MSVELLFSYKHLLPVPLTCTLIEDKNSPPQSSAYLCAYPQLNQNEPVCGSLWKLFKKMFSFVSVTPVAKACFHI